MKPETLVRFWAKVQKTPDCWIWTGSQNGSGYGEIRVLDKKLYAHRVSYELVHGPIGEKLCIDHLCRNPSCVNPDHLEAVTNQVNCLRGLGAGPHPERRKKMCIKGHLFEGNEYLRPDGKGRNCNECVRIAARNYQRRKREKLKAELEVPR